jgi:hypothetical protein
MPMNNAHVAIAVTAAHTSDQLTPVGAAAATMGSMQRTLHRSPRGFNTSAVARPPLRIISRSGMDLFLCHLPNGERGSQTSRSLSINTKTHQSPKI